ncbi:hypothetical protein EDM00_10785 [Ornithobacterium rhinotracheale]|uniref:hypothetical protein n=1 Tax=Ornithobacterium rhinotracheale TaxID=28251 RepID=UPI00129C3FC3|nr:hypothetical protein [Ornithobacterium rhinotracheale]MRI64466.1 hypothetical protein [Ornithobacterium rhinotracheale]MRJ09330.1 hypothetical protein [Ornithobacterium rhinotracheale]UOH77302.1 hypothetical protein MT996_08790 [Ornithobacterium rhinotracheale]UOH78774.1 hypothetical protein MT996_04695 [Ornithobacterium rhinotracheale]
MDKLILNGTNGFPLHTDTLAEAQRAWNIFNAISGITGDLAILQGCEQKGSSVSDGVVVIKGEVLNFKGGAVMPTIIIEEKITERAFKDKNKKPVFATRTAKFGAGSNAHNWADFKRFKPLPALQEEKEDKTTVTALDKKLTKLEKLIKNTIPVGLVAIWDRPANEIPAGWVEHTDLRGRVPAGQGSGEFSTLGAEIGEAKHTLTIAEMPRHSHKFKGRITQDDKGTGADGTEYSTQSYYGLSEGVAIDYQGGDVAHNNIQPTRIVKFIRFVGFED